MLGALWVTALTNLSARPTATSVMTEVGANLLNPYLSSASVGVTESSYAKLLQTATAHPSQPLALSFLKVSVPGNVIVGHSYSDGVRIIYGKVAEAYYDGGATNVLSLPPQLKQVLDTYGLFTSGQALQQLQQQHSVGGTQLPSLPQLPQLPPFLQPFFTFVGLSPTTLTAEGHAHLASLLIWFWLAALVTGGLVLLLTSGPQRFPSVARTILHGSWPVLAIFGIVWLIASRNEAGFKPYSGIYGLIVGAFLPVYGIAAVVGLAGWLLPRAFGVFAGRGGGQPAPARVPVAAGVPASRAGSALPTWQQGREMGGMPPQVPDYQPYSPEAPRYPSYESQQPVQGPYQPREPYPSRDPYPPQSPSRGPYSPQAPANQPYPPQTPRGQPYPPPGYQDPGYRDPGYRDPGQR